MNFLTQKRRRRRSKKSRHSSWLILLLIGAGLVYSLFSPAETTQRSESGRTRAPSATPRSRTSGGAVKPTAAPARATRIPSATIPPTAPSATGCYPQEEALVKGEMNIRERPSTAARILGSTPPGERYKVLASRQGADYCWIDIGLGWIAATEYVSGGQARASAPVQAPESAPAARNAAVQGALDALNRLTVAAENRCTEYDRGDYPYPQSVELDIIQRLGGRVYGPYTGTTFSSRAETDIEHIVATSEAHDSGLCRANAQTRKTFARDLLNLTLASAQVNRHQKRGYDFAEWTPARNKCWYADTIIRVKTKYRLTVDSREKQALAAALLACASVAMR